MQANTIQEKAFREAFTKYAKLRMPSIEQPKRHDHTTIDFKKGLLVGGLAGALEGASEAVASHASKGRALTLGALTAGLGASEAVHLGDNAPLSHKLLHTGIGSALGGGIGYYLGGEGATPKRRLIAAGLGAISTGLMSSM